MRKRLTESRLMNIALFYLSRYDASAQKVRDVLKRRLKRMAYRGDEVPPEANMWIENIVQKLQNQSYVNDSRYAENQVRILADQGKSEHFICSKLALAGIESERVKEILGAMESTEETRAKRFVERKKIGYLRPLKTRTAYWEKDMATLARAGFSYEVARLALKENNEE